MIEYGEHYASVSGGRGDPINVLAQTRPVATSLDTWKRELASDPRKHALAADIVTKLDPRDVALWGFEHSALLPQYAQPAPDVAPPTKRKTNSFLLQRRIMLALKKDIRQRPHGKLVERLRYYCNVLLRD